MTSRCIILYLISRCLSQHGVKAAVFPSFFLMNSGRSAIRRLYKKTGISGWHVGTHALRRTLGSRLYNAGNDLKTVADFLGHSSVSATKAYVRIDVDSLKDVTSSWPRRMSHE